MEHDEDSSNEDLVGKVFTIKFCNGAQDSFIQASSRISPVQKRTKSIAKMLSLLTRISNGEKLAAGEIVTEAKLPSKKKFKALKKIPIRCYFWYSDTYQNVIFVSHFIYKDFNDLDKRDIERVCENWRNMER